MACFGLRRYNRRPTWIVIHIHRVRGLPRSCSDAIFCQFIRRSNRRYSSQVTLAKNGTAVFDTWITLKCTILSHPNGEIAPKWARIEVRPVDCWSKGSYHEYYSSKIDLSEFFDQESVNEIRTLTLAKGHASVSLDISIGLTDKHNIQRSVPSPIALEERKLSSFAASVALSKQQLPLNRISIQPLWKENVKKPLLQDEKAG